MQYVHIRNLEKYHPGYKDRELKWAKMFFTMVQGDPEFEIVDNEVDKWRFAAMVCLELEARKPLPDSDIYWSKKFDIKSRPMSLTLKMLHNFVDFVTEDEKLCSVEVDKEEDIEQYKEEEEEDKEKQASPALQAALKEVSKEGFNIYPLLTRLKRELHQPAEWRFPEPVVINVCQAFVRERPKIKSEWPWFVKVMKQETALYFANQNISEHKVAQEGGVSLGDILRRAHDGEALQR